MQTDSSAVDLQISLFTDVNLFLDAIYEQWPDIDKDDHFLFYFHHPEWIDIVWKYWESRRGSILLLFLIHNGPEIVGWWPLVLSKRSFGYRLQCLGQEISDYSFSYIKFSARENCSDVVMKIMRRAFDFRKKFGFSFFSAFLYPTDPFTDNATEKLGNWLHMSTEVEWLISEPMRNHFISFASFKNEFEQYLHSSLSRRFRENLNRYTRKLDKLGKVEVSWVKEKHMLQKLLPLYARWYRYGAGADAPDKTGLWARYYMEKVSENLRFSLLSVNQEPVSFIIGFARGRQFDLFSPVFNPSFTRHGVGKVHLYQLLKILFNEGYGALNFLAGDDNYKKHWATGYYSTWDLRCFHTQSASGIFYYLKDYLRKRKI